MHFPSLLEIAKAEGLELVLFTGLHKFYADVLHGKSLSDLSGAPVAVRSPLMLAPYSQIRRRSRLCNPEDPCERFCSSSHLSSTGRLLSACCAHPAEADCGFVLVRARRRRRTSRCVAGWWR